MIGFDDSSLVTFNEREMTRLIVESYLDELVDKHGYPSEIRDFDYKQHLSSSQRGVVWDAEKGTLLQLSEDQRITHCRQGFDQLTSSQI